MCFDLVLFPWFSLSQNHVSPIFLLYIEVSMGRVIFIGKIEKPKRNGDFEKKVAAHPVWIACVRQTRQRYDTRRPRRRHRRRGLWQLVASTLVPSSPAQSGHHRLRWRRSVVLIHEISVPFNSFSNWWIRSVELESFLLSRLVKIQSIRN